MIRYTCPKCHAVLERPSTMAGKGDECPHCQNRNVVPKNAGGWLWIGVLAALLLLAGGIVWVWQMTRAAPGGAPGAGGGAATRVAAGGQAGEGSGQTQTAPASMAPGTEAATRGTAEIGRPATAGANERIVDLSDNVTMKLALLPAGTFTMGTPMGETGRYADEGPQHKVTLTKAYYMAETEVTQAQWEAVMGAGNNPSYFFTGDDLPVEEVSWDDAVDFCKKLSQKEGKTCRLPTEAEWEYACRGSTVGPYFTGTGEEALKQAGWYRGNSANMPHQVGQKEANDFGLYDMHGNVWEWCGDWYAEGYPAEDQTDPTGPVSGTERVLRGGSWFNNAASCRSGLRGKDAPDFRYYYIGFRVVVEE